MSEDGQQADVVRREVAPDMLAGVAARRLTIGRVYPAARAEVWDACTRPERISRWFTPVTGELRPGGRYQLTGNASGTIERCDPPAGFAASWEFGGSVARIEVRLTALTPAGTLLELAHTVPVDEHWAQFGPGAAGVGWDLALTGLARYGLAPHPGGPAAAAKPDPVAWLGSAEGRELVALSGEAWCAADVAAGTPEADAHAAAGRTAAAYTPAPPAPAP